MSEDMKAAQDEVAVTNESTAVMAQPKAQDSIIISPDADYSSLTLQQRAAILSRVTEAQAAQTLPADWSNVDITITNLTVYRRYYDDQETGEIGLATYVSFTGADGQSFKTSSSQALPFAMQVATLIGYDPETGALPVPILIRVVPQKAPQGFIYRFVFKGLAG